MKKRPAKPGVLEELGIDRKIGEASQELVYNLGRVYAKLNRLLSRALSGTGLTLAQFNAMALIRYGGELAQKDLGQKLFVSGANVTGLVDRLERELLVVRKGTSDRRVRLVSLTELGEHRLEEVWEIYAAQVSELTGGLSDSRKARLISLLGIWRTSLPDPD